MAQLVTAFAPTACARSAPTRGSVRPRSHRRSPIARERDSLTYPAVPATPVFARCAQLARGADAHEAQTPGVELLGAYLDAGGRGREVIAIQRGDGRVLVIDRDELTLGDRRLLACLAADEPESNAALLCTLYLKEGNRGRCRRVVPEDLIDQAALAQREDELLGTRSSLARELTARDGDSEKERAYSLAPVPTGRGGAELRWQVRPRARAAATPLPVSLRQVVAAIESYEPVFERTLAALAAYERDRRISGAALRHELERLQESPVILNRGLREAVNAAVARGLSMGEIAVRCNRIKRDGHGNRSGETSWLGRRIGILPESGSSRPTPWIHSDVLALIAREGLGICPHEVEL